MRTCVRAYVFNAIEHFVKHEFFLFRPASHNKMERKRIAIAPVYFEIFLSVRAYKKYLDCVCCVSARARTSTLLEQKAEQSGG